jgi:hypothetical protein
MCDFLASLLIRHRHFAARPGLGPTQTKPVEQILSLAPSAEIERRMNLGMIALSMALVPWIYIYTTFNCSSVFFYESSRPQ